MNILAQPVVGSFLRWRHARLAFQVTLLLVATAVVLHGLFGPQLAPRNLATVLTSIHWRGFLVVGLVIAGNLFCTACPMVLARDVSRRLVHPAWRWPRRLRGKWVGIALLALVLFSYELFDLWSLPRATAWLVIGYFAAAVLVDTLFAGATFCKHLCPIGQFNFTASTLSPLEIRVIDRDTCRTCRTSDCIKGRYSATTPGQLEQRGCELGLFLPLKVGNLDCTLCLDCVQACPHDNVALATRTPGAELLETARRSGIGRLRQRTDLAVLAIVFTFAGLVSAFAMTSLAVTTGQWVGATLNTTSETLILGLAFVSGLVILPTLLLGSAGLATRAATKGTALSSVIAFAYALVPIGFGIWLAHYGFHLLTGVLTLIPVTQSAAIDLIGSPVLGSPAWGWVGLQPGVVFPLQLGCVMLGAAGSIGTVWAIAHRDHPLRPYVASGPWLAVVVFIAAIAVWILSQPMDMRGVSVLG